jgi:hypothetical protein
MSESAAVQSNPPANRTDAADERAIAQVEKWMAVIRELGHEPTDNALSAGARLHRLLAPVTE